MDRREFLKSLPAIFAGYQFPALPRRRIKTMAITRPITAGENMVFGTGARRDPADGLYYKPSHRNPQTVDVITLRDMLIGDTADAIESGIGSLPAPSTLSVNDKVYIDLNTGLLTTDTSLNVIYVGHAIENAASGAPCQMHVFDSHESIACFDFYPDTRTELGNVQFFNALAVGGGTLWAKGTCRYGIRAAGDNLVLIFAYTAISAGVAYVDVHWQLRDAGTYGDVATISDVQFHVSNALKNKVITLEQVIDITSYGAPVRFTHNTRIGLKLVRGGYGIGGAGSDSLNDDLLFDGTEAVTL